MVIQKCLLLDHYFSPKNNTAVSLLIIKDDIKIIINFK
jgi:hypothetical protein